jgi:hypothetical protein
MATAFQRVARGADFYGGTETAAFVAGLLEPRCRVQEPAVGAAPWPYFCAVVACAASAPCLEADDHAQQVPYL